MLAVKNLSKKMDGNKVLKEVSFSLSSGKISALVGRNGAGKTTLLRLMMGILDPDQGTVELDGLNLHLQPEVKKKMVYVPDTTEVFNGYKAGDMIRLYQLIYPHFNRTECLELMEKFELPPNKKLRHYSKGMRMLFLLILAFSSHASIILLDEPTNGLDPVVKKKVLRLLVEKVADTNAGVLISSHQLEEIERIADEVVFLKEGQISEIVSFSDTQERVGKWQVVFKGEGPQTILNHPHIRIVSQTGRVYTLLAEGEIQILRSLIQKENPLLFESLGVTLEDLYFMKLGDDDYVS